MDETPEPAETMPEDPPVPPADASRPFDAAPEPPKETQPPSDAPPKRASIIDAVADLLQFIVDWLRQEAEAAVREKVVLPIQKLGLTLAAASAAGCLAALGIGFIATGVFILLGQWLTYPGALLLIGGILLVGSVVFTVIKVRGMQK